LAAERKAVYKEKDLELYFKEFNDTIVKYGINPVDVYNINKTGFRIGVIIKRTTTK
jgi:hypothetical protein